MISHYGMEIANDCGKCPLRRPGHFCCMASEIVRELNACSSATSYPQHAVFTTEGHPARGVFIVCQGRVKLTSMSKEGRFVILRIVQAGEIIGLSAVIGNKAYEASAETLVPTQVRFVPADDIMRVLRTHPEAAIQAAQYLSRECVSAYNEIRQFALAPTLARRLATLLLSWCAPSIVKEGELRINVHFTQKEIAEMIGTNRETVARLLSQFRRGHLIEGKGTGFYVRDLRALEAMSI